MLTNYRVISYLEKFMKTAPQSAEKISANGRPNDGARIIGLALLVFGLTFGLLASRFGLFASRVDMVESVLNTNNGISQGLKKSGIKQISRGYHGFTGNSDYLFVTLQDGSAFELPTSEWFIPDSRYATRSYVIKVNSMLEYSGAEPVRGEAKEEFMANINQDIDYAMKEALTKQSRDAQAVKSWK